MYSIVASFFAAVHCELVGGCIQPQCVIPYLIPMSLAFCVELGGCLRFDGSLGDFQTPSLALLWILLGSKSSGWLSLQPSYTSSLTTISELDVYPGVGQSPGGQAATAGSHPKGSRRRLRKEETPSHGKAPTNTLPSTLDYCILNQFFPHHVRRIVQSSFSPTRILSRLV